MKTLITILLNTALLWAISIASAEESPHWNQLHSFGGNGMDIAYDVTADRDGNIITVGTFTGAMNIAGTPHQSLGNSSAIIIKQNAHGDVLWSLSVGGSGYDYAYSVTTDANGNIYVGGAFSSIATFANLEAIAFGTRDAYVLKLNRDGDLIWFQQFGGIGSDFVRSLALDHDGKLVVTGWFHDDVAFGNHVLNANLNADGFILRMGMNGSVEWARRIPASNIVNTQKVIVDAENNYYVTGQFGGTLTLASTSVTATGTHDAFLSKYSSQGELLWVRTQHGHGNQIGFDLYADHNNDILITGYFSHDLNIGNTQLISNGYDDIFVAKYTSEGNPIWATHAGGERWDYGRGIHQDNDGNYLLTGYFYGEAQFGDITLNAMGGSFDYDGFWAEIDLNGQFVSAEVLGGNRSDFILGIAKNGTRGHMVFGYFYEVFNAGNLSTHSAGSSDLFVAHYGTVAPHNLLATTADWNLHNDSLYVNINVENARDLYYYSLEVSFDNNKLQFAYAKKGDFLGEQSVLITGQLQDSRGISIGKTSGAGENGYGNILTLAFSVNRSGFEAYETDILFQNIQADNSAMEPIATEGSFYLTVTGEAEFIVWPGDANNDGVVDEADVLALGMHWGKTGEARPAASIQWAPQLAQAWSDRPATFADTDGDGRVDHNDLRAISHNFGKTTTSGQQLLATQSVNNEHVTTIGQLRKGDRMVYEVKANRERRIIGLAARYTVEGVDPDAYIIHPIQLGDWADEMLSDNNTLVMQREQDDYAVIAIMQTTDPVTYRSHEDMVIMRVIVEATKDWDTNGFLKQVRLHRVCPVDGEQNMQSDTGMTMAYAENDSRSTDNMPVRFELVGNYPNPFNPTTTIQFGIPEDQHVSIRVYNLIGNEVATLVNQPMNQGYHEVQFNANELSSGVYIYRMQAGGTVQTRKMVLVK